MLEKILNIDIRVHYGVKSCNDTLNFEKRVVSNVLMQNLTFFQDWPFFSFSLILLRTWRGVDLVCPKRPLLRRAAPCRQSGRYGGSRPC